MGLAGALLAGAQHADLRHRRCGGNIARRWNHGAPAVFGAAHNGWGLVVARAPVRPSAQSWKADPWLARPGTAAHGRDARWFCGVASMAQATRAEMKKCNYLDAAVARELYTTCDNVLGKLVNMIVHPEQWVIER